MPSQSLTLESAPPTAVAALGFRLPPPGTSAAVKFIVGNSDSRYPKCTMSIL